MKRRVRVTVQITREDRRKLDRLVFDHRGNSISEILRIALRQYLERVRNKKVAGEATNQNPAALGTSTSLEVK